LWCNEFRLTVLFCLEPRSVAKVISKYLLYAWTNFDFNSFNKKWSLKACPNRKCWVIKHFTVWPLCLVLFDCVWLCLVLFNTIWGPSNIRSNNLKRTFLLFSCLMDDVLFVWTAISNIVWRVHTYHACSAACIYSLICVWSNMF